MAVLYMYVFGFQRTILSQSSQPTDFAQSEVCFERFSIPDPLDKDEVGYTKYFFM